MIIENMYRKRGVGAGYYGCGRFDVMIIENMHSKKPLEVLFYLLRGTATNR